MDALGLGLALGLAASISPGPLLVLVVTSALRSGWRAGALTACAPLLSDAAVVAVTLLLLDRLPGRALGVLGVVGAVFVVWTGAQTIRDARSASLTDQHPPPDRSSPPDRPSPTAQPSPPENHASQGSPPRGTLNSILPPGTDNSGSTEATTADATTHRSRAGQPNPDQPNPDQPNPDQPNPDQPKPDQPKPDQPKPADAAALRRAVLVNLLSPHPWIAWATALGPLTITTWRTSAVAGAALLTGFYLTLVGGKVVIALLVARGRRRLGDTAYRRTLTAAGALLVLAGVVMGVEFATL
ncbi:LysE family transporter [Actinosynnema sp. NPDC023794]